MNSIKMLSPQSETQITNASMLKEVIYVTVSDHYFWPTDSKSIGSSASTSNVDY